MDDDQQRRLDALHRLAQEQLRAQQPARPLVKEAASREGDDEVDLVVEPLPPSVGAATSASTRLSRRSSRGLVWTLLGGVALVAVIFGGVFARGRFLPTPTPTPTTGPGNALIVTSNVTFGTVTLNGKKLDGTVPLLVRLDRGESALTFSAPPFRDQTCRVTMLPQPDAKTAQRVQAVGDGCSVGGQEPSLTLNGVVVSNGYLVFERAGADLPADQRNAAVNALWLKLANLPALQVPTGDYYATGTTSTGHIISARAAVPLKATLALAHDNSTQEGSSCGYLGCAGQPILPDQGETGIPAGIWRTTESVAIGWRFTTQSGALVATAPLRGGVVTQVGLTYSAMAGWAVAEGAPGPFMADLQMQLMSGSCQGGIAVLQALAEKSSLAGQQLSYSQGAAGGVLGTSTDGCAISAESQGNNPLTPNGGAKQYGRYVWRWGVLLAADALAHTFFPSLPIAPKGEIAAVGA
jgi:hypothetical protein